MKYKTILSLLLSAGMVFGMQAKTSSYISDEALRHAMRDPKFREHIVQLLLEPQYKTFGQYIKEMVMQNKGKIAIGTLLCAYIAYRLYVQLQPKKVDYPDAKEYEKFVQYVAHGLISTGRFSSEAIAQLLSSSHDLLKQSFDSGASASSVIQQLMK